VEAAEKQGITVTRGGFWDKGGVTLLAGLTGDRFIAMTLAHGGLYAENKPEGVLARYPTNRSTKTPIAAGTDKRGAFGQVIQCEYYALGDLPLV
jgi:hypothetical protein